MSIGSALRHWIRTTPDELAVDDDRGALSYSEFGARADALAVHLLDAGVRPGDVVGLALDDSVDLLVATAATVLAGAVYLALDPGLPAERLRYLVEEAQPQVMLVREGREVAITGPAQLALDGLSTRVDADEAARLPPTTGEDFACIYFTSGSTGRPKGVPLPHRGVTRLFTGEPPMDFAPRTRMAHAAYPMFDATTLEVWGPLLQGGTVVVLARSALLDPVALREVLRARRIDVLFVTTALFKEIAAREPSAFADLDALFVGGEALDAASAGAVVAAGRPRRFRNLYGPTETTTLATWSEVTAAPSHQSSIAIGQPVPRTSVYVLDDRLDPMEPGQTGELYVGGDGLGCGYLSHGGLTACRYLPDPFSRVRGARMYRTGDIVTLLPDRSLLFCGRQDRQVKLRGFRIELEEIESVLAGHPEMGTSVVEVTSTPHGQRQLVAFIAADGLRPDEVLAYLAERLPGHMVPSVAVILDSLPVTLGGKVDRARLRAFKPSSAGTLRMIQGSAADRVAAAWADVLGTPDIARDRNFFDVGGTSLLLMQLQAALGKAADWPVRIGDLLAHPTVAAQAALIEGRTGPAANTVGVSAPDAAATHAVATDDPATARERLRRRRTALMGRGSAADE